MAVEVRWSLAEAVERCQVLATRLAGYCWPAESQHKRAQANSYNLCLYWLVTTIHECYAQPMRYEDLPYVYIYDFLMCVARRGFGGRCTATTWAHVCMSAESASEHWQAVCSHFTSLHLPPPINCNRNVAPLLLVFTCLPLAPHSREPDCSYANSVFLASGCTRFYAS